MTLSLPTKDTVKTIFKSKATWAFIAVLLGSVGATIDPTIVTTVGCSLMGGCGQLASFPHAYYDSIVITS